MFKHFCNRSILTTAHGFCGDSFKCIDNDRLHHYLSQECKAVHKKKKNSNMVACYQVNCKEINQFGICIIYMVPTI